mgnify:CR=1 FL=1
MRFELNEFHRNVPDTELIEDLQRVSNLLKQDTVTMDAYTQYGKFHATTLTRRFGNWKKTLELAGLSTTSKNFYISNDDYIFDLKRVASILNKNTIIISEYEKLGKYSIGRLLARFGSWDSALKTASLEPTGYHRKVTNLDLFQDIENTWIYLGRQPKTSDIKSKISKYGMTTYARHFGSWRNALEAFVEYIDSEDATINCASSNNIKEQIYENTDIDDFPFYHKTKREINLRMRFCVLKRDNFKCCACGASPAKDPAVKLHVDHIIPWSKGGETVINNLQTLCSRCNLGKSDLMLG